MTGWLEGYVALVTGGGSGIGRAVADRFVSEGASVTIVGRNHDRLAGAVKASPDSSRMHAVEADVRSSEQLHQAVGATVDRFGKLDTLVANAGIWDYQRQLTRLSAHELGATFDELFAINVKGYFLAAEAAWRELVKTRGSIVMTLSNASFYVNGGGASGPFLAKAAARDLSLIDSASGPRRSVFMPPQATPLTRTLGASS